MTAHPHCLLCDWPAEMAVLLPHAEPIYLCDRHGADVRRALVAAIYRAPVYRSRDAVAVRP